MMVYDELLDGQDDLEVWARNHRKSGMFVDPDMATQAQLQAVCTHVIGRYPDNGPRRRFLDRADPWVIAHALANDGTVVTHEQKNPATSSKVKIPNVCEQFDMRCIDVYQMLREQGASWTG